MSTLDAARAADMLRSGLSLTRAAARLGVSRATLRRRLPDEPGRPHHKFTPDEVARIEALLADGASLSECARTVGVNEGSVRNRWRGRGWDREACVDYCRTLRHYDPDNHSTPSL